MTNEELKNIVQNTVNAVADGSMPTYEAIPLLLNKFNEALEPFVKSRKHLQLFITRVQDMRDLQKQFFGGNRKVLIKSKLEEQKVDNAIKKLISELGYTPEEIQQAQQQELQM